MAIHVAILKRPYLDLILAGRKTIESRITKTAQPPYRAVEPGERVFLKYSGGAFAGIAVAGRVDCFEGLTPERLEQLRRRYDDRVLGGRDYWKTLDDCRYATFVELRGVEPFDTGPTYTKSLRAWHVLDDSRSPLLEVALTAGAIRNRYATMPGSSDGLRSEGFTLVLPDGRELDTDIAKGNMIRWRGWGAYYDEHGMRAGDAVRFVAVGRRRYRVSFKKKHRP